MTNAQLYIAFAIPSTIALLGVLSTLAGFLLQSKRLDGFDALLDRIDNRLDAIATKLAEVGERLSAVEVRVAHLENPQ